MSRGVLLWACAVTSLSVAVPSVFAVSEADWDLRYRGAVKSCILKSQRTQTCTRVIDGNPLELSGLAYTLLYKTVYPTVWR